MLSCCQWKFVRAGAIKSEGRSGFPICIGIQRIARPRPKDGGTSKVKHITFWGLPKLGISKHQCSNLVQKFNRNTNVQFTTIAPILANPCYSQWFLSSLSTKYNNFLFLLLLCWFVYVVSIISIKVRVNVTQIVVKTPANTACVAYNFPCTVGKFVE